MENFVTDASLRSARAASSSRQSLATGSQGVCCRDESSRCMSIYINMDSGIRGASCADWSMRTISDIGKKQSKSFLPASKVKVKERSWMS